MRVKYYITASMTLKIYSSYVDTTAAATREIMIAGAFYTTETNPKKRITTDLLQCTGQCQSRVRIVECQRNVEFGYIWKK